MKSRQCNSNTARNSIIKKQGINYLRDENGKIKKYKPWLGDLFSFLYDRIMVKSLLHDKNLNCLKFNKLC